jgi:hypothetical protein
MAVKLNKDIVADVKIGILIAQASLSNVSCPKHPKYGMKRRPNSKFSSKDGCLCHIAWSVAFNIQQALNKDEEQLLALEGEA